MAKKAATRKTAAKPRPSSTTAKSAGPLYRTVGGRRRSVRVGAGIPGGKVRPVRSMVLPADEAFPLDDDDATELVGRGIVTRDG